MDQLPEGLSAYRRTATFTETTIPAGLLKDHETAAGVWAVIHVESGQLRYVVPSGGDDFVLDSETLGFVVPETLHHVAPLGPVSFFVEFWRDAGTT